MDKFNSIYKDFLTYLLKNVPAYKKIINTNIENENNYITNFIQFNLPYFESISNRNKDIFTTKYGDVQLIKDLRFKKVIKVLKKKNDLENIWQYLHKLYIIAYNSCDLKNLVKKYPNHNELSKILANHNLYIENIMLSGPVKQYESSSDSDSDGESEGESDEEEQKLREEFERSILNKKSKGSNGSKESKGSKGSKESNGINGSKESKESDNESKGSNGSNGSKGTDKKKELEEGEIDEDEDKETVENNSKSPMENFGSMFDGTIIGSLAKEISDGIDPKDLEFDLGNMENPSDMFKGMAALMSNGKMQNIIGTVGQRMKEKMEKGEINQAQLLQETMAAAGKMNGQMGDISKLFQQMGGSGGMPDLASMMGMAQNGGKKKKRHHKKRH